MPYYTPKQYEITFWKKVKISSNDECWEWQAGKDAQGYGRSKRKGRYYRAHRIAWLFTNGPVPEGLCVLHKCDNPSCVNPSHLFIGTQADNVEDAVTKDRYKIHPRHSGEKAHNVKLTANDVRNIRHLYKQGHTLTEIADKYPVQFQQISRIINKQSWSHID